MKKGKKRASKYNAIMVYHSVGWGGSDGGGRGRIQALVGCVGNILGRVECHRHHQCLFTFRFSPSPPPPKKQVFDCISFSFFLFLSFFSSGNGGGFHFWTFWLAFSCVPRRHCNLGSTVVFLVFLSSQSHIPSALFQ